MDILPVLMQAQHLCNVVQDCIITVRAGVYMRKPVEYTNGAEKLSDRVRGHNEALLTCRTSG